jgi:hypothetical protein
LRGPTAPRSRRSAAASTSPASPTSVPLLRLCSSATTPSRPRCRRCLALLLLRRHRSLAQLRHDRGHDRVVPRRSRRRSGAGGRWSRRSSMPLRWAWELNRR